jgi:hypothetical protein
VLGQLREGAENLRLRLRNERRPSAASRWRRWWFERIPFGAEALHRLHPPLFPHPRGHPSRAGLPTAGEPVDLASGLRGPCFLKPPLPAFVHGRKRPGLAILCYGACAAPAMEPTPRLAGHRPLPAKTVAVTCAGAATLPIFPVRTGFHHRRDLSMQIAFLVLHLGT